MQEEPNSIASQRKLLLRLRLVWFQYQFFIFSSRCLGNVTPVSREPLQMTFSPFRENRLSATVRVTDPSQPFTCRLAFLKEPRKDRQGNVRTICNLTIDLSEEVRRDQCLISLNVTNRTEYNVNSENKGKHQVRIFSYMSHQIFRATKWKCEACDCKTVLIFFAEIRLRKKCGP